MIDMVDEMLKIFEDRECTKALTELHWENQITMSLVDGTKRILKNTVRSGEEARASMYLKNDTEYSYFITDIIFKDDRVKFTAEKAEILPSEVIRVDAIYRVPMKARPTDMIKADDVIINGYFLFLPSI